MATSKTNIERGIETRARIAELVSEGCTVNTAGKLLGMSSNGAWKAWQKLCADLGPQAQ